MSADDSPDNVQGTPADETDAEIEDERHERDEAAQSVRISDSPRPCPY